MAMDGLHPLVGTFLMLLFLLLPCLFVLLAGAQAAARSSMVNLVLHDNADAADAENFLTMKRTKESSVLGDLGMKSQKRMKESSVLGDPGMKSQKVRVAVEGWNFCNRVGEEDSPPQSPSPRWADCADLDCNLLSKGKNSALKSPTLAWSVLLNTILFCCFVLWLDPPLSLSLSLSPFRSLLESRYLHTFLNQILWAFAVIWCCSNFSHETRLCACGVSVTIIIITDSEGLKLCNSVNRVSEADNQLKTGDPFPTGVFENSHNADVYVVEKEKYLASLCKEEEEDDDISHRKQQQPWHFWMIMLKNGNFDTKSSLCKSYTSKPLKKSFLLPEMIVSNKKQESNFLCFGPGCMNQPLVYHNWSTTLGNNNNGVVVTSSTAQTSLAGSFYGTYDVEESSSSTVMTSHAATTSAADVSSSYFSVAWEKNLTSGSWIFTHRLSVSRKYPWLMLYLRADATSGESGGYPWETRGMMKQVCAPTTHGPWTSQLSCCNISLPQFSGIQRREKVLEHQLWFLCVLSRIWSWEQVSWNPVFCYNYAGSSFTKFQGHPDAQCHPGRRSSKPVLLDRHRRLLEKQRQTLWWWSWHRCHTLCWNDHQPQNISLVQVWTKHFLFLSCLLV